MTSRKKPTGEAWQSFVDKWNNLDHVGKVALARAHGATYDSAKHWVSEGDTTPPAPKAVGGDVVDEVLALQPKVMLDFVTFDIETSNLTADFAIVLSAVIKPFGGKPIVFRADDYPDWTNNRVNDKPIVQDIAAELSRHAVVITHYGSRFDIPFLRAKSVRYGLPPLPPMFGIDTYSIAKANFKLSSRRLKTLAEYLELGEKEPVEGSLWMQAAFRGDRQAMDRIVEHNILDTIILEKLAAVSFPYLKSLRKL